MKNPLKNPLKKSAEKSAENPLKRFKRIFCARQKNLGARSVFCGAFLTTATTAYYMYRMINIIDQGNILNSERQYYTVVLYTHTSILYSAPLFIFQG